MNWMFLSLIILIALVAVPFVVYFSAQLGIYGALVGLRKFRLDYPKDSTNERT